MSVRIARRSRGGSGVEIAWTDPGSRAGCPPCVTLEHGDRAAARAGATRGRSCDEQCVVRASDRPRKRHPRPRPHAASHALQPAAHRRALAHDLSRRRGRESRGACAAVDRASLRRRGPALQRASGRPHRRRDGLDVADVPELAPRLVPARDRRLSGRRGVRDLHRRDDRRRRIRRPSSRPRRHAEDVERRALPARADAEQSARVSRHEPCARAVRASRAARQDRGELSGRARGAPHREPPRANDRRVVPGVRRSRRRVRRQRRPFGAHARGRRYVSGRRGPRGDLVSG